MDDFSIVPNQAMVRLGSQQDINFSNAWEAVDRNDDIINLTRSLKIKI